MNQFERTERLIGKTGLARLKNAHVAVFGLGGVGGHCAEALCRAGIGRLTIVDGDEVALSNLNRQLVAAHSTIGRKKAHVMRERLLDINPDADISAQDIYFGKTTLNSFDFGQYDYVADCIDSVSDKLLLITTAKQANAGIISAMGAGNKLQTAFEVADISKTSVCPLARVIRTGLRKSGIETGLKCVYSKEPPIKHEPACKCDACAAVPASISFVPPVSGLTLAGEIIRDLLSL